MSRSLLPICALLAVAPSLLAQGAYKAVLDSYHIYQQTYCSSSKREVTERDIPGAGAAYSMTAQRSCIGSSHKLDISVGLPPEIRGNLIAGRDMQFDAQPTTSARMTVTATYPDAKGHLAYISVPSSDRAGCPTISPALIPFKGTQTTVLTMAGCTRAQTFQTYDPVIGGPRFLQINTWFSSGTFPNMGSEENPSIAVEIDAIYRIEQVSADLAFDHLEVVQVVQDKDNTVPLIQGKPAVVRVFPKLASTAPGGPTSQTNVTAQLRAYFRGNELPLSPIQPFNGPITVGATFDRDNPDHSLNFRIPHIWTLNSNISFTAEIKGPGSTPDPTPTDNIGVTSVSLRPSPTLNVAWLPLCLKNAFGNALCPDTASLARHGIYVEKVFPVAPANFNYTQLLLPQRLYGGFFDDAQFDSYLRRFHDLFASGYDQLAFWIIDLMPSGNRTTGSSDPMWFDAERKGRVSWQTDWVAVDPQYPARTLGHEIAHNLGRRHTHRVDGCGARDAETDWPVDFARSNIMEPGFDPILRKIKPSRLFDLMTYCAPPVDDTWISPFTYQALLQGGFSPASVPSQRLAEGDWILISGNARRDGSGGTLLPGIRVRDAGSPLTPPAAPTHCVRFFGEAGVLGEQCLVLTFRDHRFEDVIFEQEWFSVKTPFPSGTTRIALFAGDVELASISPGAATPEVTITSPQTGDTWDGGTRTITWTATDADNDTLTYSVLYSSDSGVNWLPMDLDLTTPQYTFDPSQITGGKAVLFRVLATDGIHTGSADIGPLEVIQIPKLELAVDRLDHRKAVLKGVHDATLIATNSGTGPLNITALTPSTEEFTVLSRLPIMIPAGQTFPIDLRFEPAQTGRREARLTIESTDPVRPSVEIVLAGMGLATAETDLEFSTSALAYGDVNIGVATLLPVVIRNYGPATSFINGPTFAPGGFSFGNSTGFQIPAGGSVTYNLRFLPTATGEYTGTARFITDDPARQAVVINLTGRGVVPDAPDKACTYKLDAAAASVGPAAGTYTVDVTAAEDCPWAVSTPGFFFTVPADSGGIGNGTVTFNVTANTQARPRSAYMVIAGQTFVVVQAGTNVRFSDSLNRTDAEGCAIGKLDLGHGGTGNHYHIPIFPTPYPSIAGNALRNGGQDYGGVQFTASATPCGPAAANKGETVGADLNIQVALRVPTDANSRVTQAGPYFRARANAAGETVIGTISAGFWVQLLSTGEVKVKNLATDTIIAFSAKPASFDGSIFHVLEIAASGVNVQVVLDGRVVMFTQSSSQTQYVALPAIPAANTQNTAGIAFGAEGNRNQIGGQQAKDVIVSTYVPPGIFFGAPAIVE